MPVVLLVVLWSICAQAAETVVPPNSEYLLEKAVVATESREVRQKVFLSQLNSDLRPCFDRHCPLGQVYSVELDGADGKQINPKAQGLFDDQHRLCTTETGCQWMFWTAVQPVCDPAPCFAERFDFFFSQSYEPPTPIKGTGPRTTYALLRVPRDSVYGIYEWRGQSCAKQGSGLVFWGFSADGKIHCAPPLDLKAEDIKPTIGVQHERDIVMNFQLPGIPMTPNSPALRARQIAAQLKIFTQSGASLLQTATGQGGLKPCPKLAGKCFAKVDSRIELADGTRLLDALHGMNTDMKPCDPRKAASGCTSVKVDLEFSCEGEECLKIEGKLNALIGDAKLEIPFSNMRTVPTKPNCPAGTRHLGWDEKGTPECAEGVK